MIKLSGLLLWETLPMYRWSEKRSIAPLWQAIAPGIDLDLNRMQGTLAPKRKEATWSSGENYDVQCIINSSVTTMRITVFKLFFQKTK